jgi:DNA-binding response OmpR family regulator
MLNSDHITTTNQVASPRQPTTSTPRALSVLLVEDDVHFARMLKKFFEMNGHHPAVAHLGCEAMRLEARQFQLALVDIDLPDTTGFKVVAQALAHNQLQGTKIIFCSGDPSEERVAMADQFPGSRFLPKPLKI